MNSILINFSSKPNGYYSSINIFFNNIQLSKSYNYNDNLNNTLRLKLNLNGFFYYNIKFTTTRDSQSTESDLYPGEATTLLNISNLDVNITSSRKFLLKWSLNEPLLDNTDIRDTNTVLVNVAASLRIDQSFNIYLNTLNIISQCIILTNNLNYQCEYTTNTDIDAYNLYKFQVETYIKSNLTFNLYVNNNKYERIRRVLPSINEFKLIKQPTTNGLSYSCQLNFKVNLTYVTQTDSNRIKYLIYMSGNNTQVTTSDINFDAQRNCNFDGNLYSCSINTGNLNANKIYKIA